MYVKQSTDRSPYSPLGPVALGLARECDIGLATRDLSSGGVRRYA